MRQLFMTSILVGSVMTGVIWLFIAVRAVEHIINRGVSVKIFLQLSALQIPNFIIHIIPFAIFIATIFVYSRLNSDRELIVMQAAGASPISLAKPAIIMAFFAIVIGYFMTLYVTPKSYQGFRNLQWDIRYSFAHVLLKEGVFNSISDKITIFIRERKGRSELRGILYHDATKIDKPVTIIAERGVLTKSRDGARVTVFEGNRQEIQKKNKNLSILYFDRYTLDLSGFTPKPNNRFREARERMVDELLELKIQDVGNPLDFGKFKVEAHQRLTTPMNTLTFTLVAILCLLLGDFSRRGQANRIILASIIFFTLWVGNLGIISVSAKNLQLIPFIYLSTFGPILIMLILITLNPRFKIRKA